MKYTFHQDKVVDKPQHVCTGNQYLSEPQSELLRKSGDTNCGMTLIFPQSEENAIIMCNSKTPEM